VSGRDAAAVAAGGRRSDVVVLGSANVDLVLSVAELPRPGETVLAARISEACGGKGANQAIAAARSGAHTRFLGAVGADAGGELLQAALRDAGIDDDGVRVMRASTGMAVVTVDEHGENSIVVVPGANAELVRLDADELEHVRRARVLLAQLETPVTAFEQAARCAREAGVRTILNAVPADRPLDDELWGLVDVLVVNEHEAAQLSGLGRASEAVGSLLLRTSQVVITLGAAGALIADREGRRVTVPAPPARVVDSTGAGDTFCGVLAGCLARGMSIRHAAEHATSAGSLAVERRGAVPSIPPASAIAVRHSATFGHAAGL
jgi:ribokinase